MITLDDLNLRWLLLSCFPNNRLKENITFKAVNGFDRLDRS